MDQNWRIFWVGLVKNAKQEFQNPQNLDKIGSSVRAFSNLKNSHQKNSKTLNKNLFWYNSQFSEGFFWLFLLINENTNKTFAFSKENHQPWAEFSLIVFTKTVFIKKFCSADWWIIPQENINFNTFFFINSTVWKKGGTSGFNF